jgi:Subtilisin inhibitor-like
MKPDTRRARTGARYLLIAAMSAVTATACGSVAAAQGSGAGSGSAAGSSSGAAASAPKVSLDMTVTTGRPGAKPQHWTLRCDPPGGTHPDPAAACRVLLAAGAPFAPLHKHVECPMIMASSAKATIKGTWFGKKVNMVLVDGGCAMARWAKIGQIFN